MKVSYFMNKGIMIKLFSSSTIVYYYIQNIKQHIITQVRVNIILGSILVKLGRIDEALQWYDKSILLNPNDDSVYNAKGDYDNEIVGLLLKNLGRFDEAIYLYDKAI